jgi:hypothetical protein
VKVLSQIVRLAYISKSETYYKLEEHYEKATPSLSQRAYLIAGPEREKAQATRLRIQILQSG